MELRNIEIAAIEQTIKEVETVEVSELDALQLALVGGGIGEVVLG